MADVQVYYQSAKCLKAESKPLISLLELPGRFAPAQWPVAPDPLLTTPTLGTDSRGKTAVLLDFIQITSPPPPSLQFGQLIQLFSDAKIQYLKVSLELKILYILYNVLYYLKNSLKFKLLAILRI